MSAKMGILVAVLLAMVSSSLAAENETATPGVNVTNQSIMAMVIIPEVVSDGPGWVVIHNDAEGEPGQILGASRVASGVNKNIPVIIDTENLTNEVHAGLRVDAGQENVFEPDGADISVEGVEPMPFSCWHPENSWGFDGEAAFPYKDEFPYKAEDGEVISPSPEAQDGKLISPPPDTAEEPSHIDAPDIPENSWGRELGFPYLPENEDGELVFPPPESCWVEEPIAPGEGDQRILGDSLPKTA